MIASRVIICDDENQNLLGLVTRLSFYDDSASSQAVLLSTLAVSSLFRHGLNADTMRLYGGATHALQTSISNDNGKSSIVQDVATGMLLCSFEVCFNWFRV